MKDLIYIEKRWVCVHILSNNISAQGKELHVNHSQVYFFELYFEGTDCLDNICQSLL